MDEKVIDLHRKFILCMLFVFAFPDVNNLDVKKR